MHTHLLKSDTPTAKPGGDSRDKSGVLNIRDHDLLSPEQASAFSAPIKLGLSANYIDAARKVTGADVSDTLVTLNSTKPDSVGGLSCTQGSHIDLGRGRIEDIHHEVAHVAQQKRGQARIEMHFNGLPGNSDPELEKDADIQGFRIRRLAAGPVFNSKPKLRPSNPIKQPVQRFDPKKDINPEDSQFDHIRDFSFKDLINYQERLQRFVEFETSFYEEQVTTVGFEHEFAQTKSVDELGREKYSPLLKDLAHLEIAKSVSPIMVISKLPFILETDSRNALELVSPPFLLQTEKGRPLPQQKLIDRFDDIMTKGLMDLVSDSQDLGDLVDNCPDKLGIRFSPLRAPKLKPSHLNYRTPPESVCRYRSEWLTVEDIESIPVSQSNKRFRNKGFAQANIATDLETAFFMESPLLVPGFASAAYHNVMQKYIASTALSMMNENQIDKNMVHFLNFLSRVLLTQMSIEPMRRLRNLKKHRFQMYKDKAGVGAADWSKTRQAASFIRDFTGIWVKDSIINIGLGVLSFSQWQEVFEVIRNPRFEQMLLDTIPPSEVGSKNGLRNDKSRRWLPLLRNTFSLNSEDEVSTFLSEFRHNLQKALKTLRREIHLICKDDNPAFNAEEYVQAPPDVEFHGHDPRHHIRIRQDTLLDARKVNNDTMKAIWPGRFLHVVEDRRSRGVAGIAHRKIKRRDNFYRRKAHEQNELAPKPSSERVALNSPIAAAAIEYGNIIEPYLARSLYVDLSHVFDLKVVQKYVEDTDDGVISGHVKEAFKNAAVDPGTDPSKAIFDLVNDRKMLWGSDLHRALINASEKMT